MVKKYCLPAFVFVLVFALNGCGSSEPWAGIDSGQAQVFKTLHTVSMVDVLPDESTDSYGHVALLVRMDNGEIYSPLMYRRSTVLGGGGTRADVEQIIHTLALKGASGGWSTFPAPVDPRITEYVILYRGPFKRSTSAGDLEEHWKASSYTLTQLKSQNPRPGDFVNEPADLVGDNWVGLLEQAEDHRYTYRSQID